MRISRFKLKYLLQNQFEGFHILTQIICQIWNDIQMIVKILKLLIREKLF